MGESLTTQRGRRKLFHTLVTTVATRLYLSVKIHGTVYLKRANVTLRKLYLNKLDFKKILPLDKSVKTIQWEQNHAFDEWCWDNWTFIQKRMK